MPSPEMKNEFTLCCQIINSLESVGMEGTCGYGYPWKVKVWWKKEYTLFSVWEPPMIYLAWKVLGTLSRFRWWDGYTSQNVFISKFFSLSSGTSTNPYFTL